MTRRKKSAIILYVRREHRNPLRSYGKVLNMKTLEKMNSKEREQIFLVASLLEDTIVNAVGGNSRCKVLDYMYENDRDLYNWFYSANELACRIIDLKKKA